MSTILAGRPWLAVALGLTLISAACSGTTENGSSSDAPAEIAADNSFCAVLQTGIDRTVDRSELASEQSSPVGGLVFALGNLGEFSRLLDELAAEAPDEVRPDFEVVASDFAAGLSEQPTTGKGAVASVAGALFTAAVHQGSYERVENFVQQTCGVALFGSTLQPGSSGPAEPHGIVLADCQAGLARLLIVDPVTGNEVARRTFGSAARPTRLCDAVRWSPASIREMFSADYRWAAATTTGSDGSGRVGVIDTTTDDFVDLTALHEEGGFSAAIADDHHPGFVAGTDSFRFLDANTNVFFEANPSDEWQLREWTPRAGSVGEVSVRYLPGDRLVPIAAFSKVAPHDPSGEWRLGPDGLFNLDSGQSQAVTYFEPCSPAQWFDGNQVLCLVDDIGDIAIAALTEDCLSYSPTRLVDSGGERANFNPVASPDLSEVAFISVRSGQAVLFVVPVSSGEPRQVAGLGPASPTIDPASGVDVPAITLVDWVGPGAVPRTSLTCQAPELIRKVQTIPLEA